MRHVTKASELRALAHPLRMSIVEQLTLGGPLTATELGERLDELPANCSWHLRKLAEHGFVVEDESGGGRRRPWRIAETGLTYEDAVGDPEQRRAALALSDLTIGRSVEHYREAMERAADEPGEWREGAGGIQNMAWVTAEELADLNAEVRKVVMRFQERHDDPEARPPGSRLCELVAWGVPTYLPGMSETP